MEYGLEFEHWGFLPHASEKNSLRVHCPMSPQGMTLDFRSIPAITTQADFTYAVTLDTISITDTGKGRASVTNDIEAVLRKIEYWHQGSIAAFKIMYRDEHGVWDGVRWDGNHPVFFTLGEPDERRAIRKLRLFFQKVIRTPAETLFDW
jgi:hypothetical protein